ncbi:MAG: polysaccharide deacetylase family protein [Chloroflexales bacterium]|nr:polysaccharide deacetylase family protein [Chloroflexales bacterium]
MPLQKQARRPTPTRFQRILIIALLPLLFIFFASPISPPSPRFVPRSLPTAHLMLDGESRVAAAVTIEVAATSANVTALPVAPTQTTVANIPEDTSVAAAPANSATATPALSAPIQSPGLSATFVVIPPSATPEQLPSIAVPAQIASPPPASPAAAVVTSARPPAGSFIPILMYHYVRSVESAIDPLGYNLSVTADQLADQLDWLARQGYTPIRMDKLADCLSGAQTCPKRAIALTFDDGYADAYTTALPLLQKYGFVATFYIVSGFVGQAGYMNWDELRALHNAGMEIGAHSITHSDLTLMNRANAYAEIAGSGERLAAALQIPIRSFCYPGGKFNATTAELAQLADYASATTTLQTWDQRNRYSLPRIRIYGELTQMDFEWLVQSFTTS